MFNKPNIEIDKKILTLKGLLDFFPTVKNLRGKEEKEVSIEQALNLLNNFTLGFPIGEIIIRKSINKNTRTSETEVVEGFSRLKALYEVLKNENIYYDLYHEEFCKISDLKFYHMPILSILFDDKYFEYIDYLKTKCAPDFFEKYSARAEKLSNDLLIGRVIDYYRVECESIDAWKMYQNTLIKF